VLDDVGLALAGPHHAALHQHLGVGGLVKYVVVMAQRGIEHASKTPILGPCHRHIHRLIGDVIITHQREARGGQHLNGRVDVQIIVLAAHRKILQALGDGAGAVTDVDGVVDAVDAAEILYYAAMAGAGEIFG